jgi:hypothetical protein
MTQRSIHDAKYRAAHPIELAAQKKRYRQANTHKIACHRSLYRARRLNRIPPWANVDHIESMYLIARVLGTETGETYEVDHIVPLEHKLVCGLHVPANLQVITKGANKIKGNSFGIDDTEVYY